MKKVLYVFAAAVVMVACTKEWPWADKAQTGIIRSAKDGCYELFVSIDGLTDEAGKPVGESIETKAAINETDGHFTWTAGDVIDVVTSSGVYQFVAAESGAKARFVYDGDDFTGDPLRVEYPSTNSTTPAVLPTDITGNKGALSSDNLRLTGNEFDGNNVNVHHKNALVRLEFHDVPTFASKLVFDGNVNDVTVTFTPLVSRGNIVVYVPVDVATTSFSVSLRDDNNNEIVSKSTTSDKSFTAGTLKVMASVAVEGWVFLFKDSYSFADEAKFYQSSGWGDPDESKNSSQTLNSLNSPLEGGYNKWCILRSNGDWIQGGYFVCIKIYKSGVFQTLTKGISLRRDFNFEIKGDKGLVTDYRLYFYLNSPNAQNWWGASTTLYIENSKGDPVGNYSMTSSETNLFYYGHPSSLYGLSLKYYFKNSSDWYEPNGYGARTETVVMNREYWYDMNN